MSERDDEYADYLYDEWKDRMMDENLCFGCRNPMPPRPKEVSFSRPGRCPKCRPEAWIDHLQQENGHLRRELAPLREQRDELLTLCQKVRKDLMMRAMPDFENPSVKVVDLSAGLWDELKRVTGEELPDAPEE